ncbi:FeoB-associated Cys-rich membrane protein [Sphingobacterium tabacisoli]|uniref:FeoB-associated Cys-rich membrane protein n=1 Tax=Sphingobacterium tabacisoli TaxID=2044855 RepID=A0ABW5L8V2_9SPHI|nr:FeoB-associated Cys-rich membrane protein [Sphingobacterium tabacisoli]
MMYIQYAIIALVFIIAIVFMVKKFWPSKTKSGGCGKGCGCSFTEKAQN